ncbi:hypothetical protein E2562_024573 [Oryza meyeriana var. granulata]|uniref:Uncharacterized protein n=1 Tax=Oryza meyeriana var. granulata TaxID=110450 RepID=A0A6G1CSN3_9ORYZ|nr:hypothetical protein E2562_024573 [Oryza meyeriana var. granulata]
MEVGYGLEDAVDYDLSDSEVQDDRLITQALNEHFEIENKKVGETEGKGEEGDMEINQGDEGQLMEGGELGSWIETKGTLEMNRSLSQR